MRSTIKLLAVAILALPSALAPAQDLGAILKGGSLPQTISPSKLGDDMKAVKIVHEKQGGGDFFSMLTNPLMMMMGSLGQAMGGEEKQDPEQALAMQFFDRLSISWTNGSTIKLFDQDFLVTYSPQVNMAEAMKQKSPPDLSKVDLTLVLINTKAIASITPRLDITRETWMKAMEIPPAERTAANRAQTLSNIKQAAVATAIYCSDFDDVIPYAQSTKGAFEVLLPYSKNKEIFKSLNPNGAKFIMNMAVAGASMSSIENIAETVLFYEDKTWPDGSRAVAFVDGHAKMVDPETWSRLQGSLSLKLPKVGKPLPATLGSNWDGG